MAISVSKALTKEWIESEILKCGRDPIYFLKTYGKVTHQKKGLLTFKTYDFQDELLKKFKDHRFNIILKGRQLGISTIVAGFVAWLMLFHRHKEVIILATKQSKSQNMLRKVKLIYRYLPDWLRIAKYKTENRTTIELDNGSRLGAESTASDAGRSDSLALLIIDEAAHVQNMEEIWTSIYPTISTGGSCILLSSPNGSGNFFHRTYTGAENGENEFISTKLMWWVHPERDEKWFAKEKKALGDRGVAQEHECCFLASGATVFSWSDIERMKAETEEPKYKTGFDRNFWIWKEFNHGHNYLLSVDVARGDGEDYSAFHVIDVTTMEIVAEYKGKPSMDILSMFLQQVGKEYGNCMIVVENNNIGISVVEKLEAAQYENLYYSKKGSHEFIEPVMALGDSTALGGFSTTMKTRPLIIAKLEEYVRNKSIKTYSGRLIAEMDTFIWNNGKPEAMRKCNDDLIMSLAIGCWVRDTALLKSSREDDYRKSLLAGIVSDKTIFDSFLPSEQVKNYRNVGKRAEYEIRQRQIAAYNYPQIIIR